MNCESCGMPLDENSLSKMDGRYCVHCQDQTTGGLKSKEEVREGSINAAVELMGKSREDAEKMADETMPGLPRWQSETGEVNKTDATLPTENPVPTENIATGEEKPKNDIL